MSAAAGIWKILSIRNAIALLHRPALAGKLGAPGSRPPFYGRAPNLDTARAGLCLTATAGNAKNQMSQNHQPFIISEQKG